MSLEVISVIDIDTSHPYVSVVHGKQYDTVRMVEAHLFESGVKWYVPAQNIYAMISYRKSDNIGGFYDITESGTVAVSVNNSDRSIIYLALDSQILRVAGETRVDVVFYDTINSGRLGAFQFIVDVEEASIREVDLASNPYFNVLAEQIKAVLDAETELTGLTAEAHALAPDVQPTVSVSGGTGAEDPYHFNLGIPSMPGMTATASPLAPGQNPTVVITRPSQVGEDFNIAFGIPSGIGIVSIDTYYGISLSEDILPSTWVDDIEDLIVPDGYLQWTKNVMHDHNGTDYISYSRTMQGVPGPTGVAVQHAEPLTAVKIWVDPDSETSITIPEYSAAEDATIHNIGGIMLTTVKTIT